MPFNFQENTYKFHFVRNYKAMPPPLPHFSDDVLGKILTLYTGKYSTVISLWNAYMESLQNKQLIPTEMFINTLLFK